MPKEQAKFTGAFDLIGKSYDLIVKNWKPFAMLYALPFLTMLPSVGSDDSGSIIFDMAFFIVTLFLMPVVIAIMLVIYSLLLQLELDVVKGKKPTLGEVYSALRPKFWRLVGLMLIVGIMAVIGFALLIVPGLFVLQRYLLSPYYLLDQDLTVEQAMKKSAASAKKYSSNIWPIVGIIVVITVIGSLPGILAVVGFLMSVFYSVAPAIRYKEIAAAK